MIKDIKYNLNLGDENNREVETPLITGKVCGLFISAEKPSQIIVVYKDYPYAEPILQLSGFAGQKWFNIKRESHSWNGEKFNYSVSDAIFNDALLIKVGGPINNKVEVVMRYEEEYG